MGGACGTYGNTKDTYRVFIENSEEPLGRPRMVVLKLILKFWGLWIGLIWLRFGTSGVLF
jgi:hypothetical protein